MHCTCMQAKLTLKVAGGAECRGRHDDLQLADQVLYGLWIASASKCIVDSICIDAGLDLAQRLVC